jgi:Peptidase A4 family
MRHQRLISSSIGVLSLAGMLLASSSVQAAAAASQSKATKARAVVEKLHVLPSQREGSTPGAVTQFQSFNWSGYGDGQVSSAPQYTSVSAQWIQPALKCTSEDRIVVFWSGLDGLTSSTVEQDGTLAQCFQGVAFYYSWWEMYPANNIQVVGSTVKPGDHITAAVTFSATSTYTLAVTDATTTANSFTTNQTCSPSTCTRSSAEVIAERPSSAYGIYPLAQFALWSVTNVTVAPGTITTPAEAEITMRDITNTYTLAQPSSYKAATKSFTDKWKNSY